MKVILFGIIALIYASVGFGGGSGYIAILSFFNYEPSSLRFIALCCNLIVVSGGTYHFIKHKIIDWKRVFPFVLLSVPAAFIGGTIQLDVRPFYLLLGITLFLAGVLVFVKPADRSEATKKPMWFHGILGAVIGLVSGLVGIGGGIFLSPILHLSKWGSPKLIAATASFFILVNSLAGLAGQMQVKSHPNSLFEIWPLLIAVFIGGQIGSRLTVIKLTQTSVRKLTGLLVIFASIRMLIKLAV